MIFKKQNTYASKELKNNIKDDLISNFYLLVFNIHDYNDIIIIWYNYQCRYKLIFNNFKSCAL